MAKVDVRGDDECWPWRGYTNGGTPMIVIDQQDINVARVIHEANYGPLSPGDRVSRTCRDSMCCNPAHFTTELKPVCGRIGTYSLGCRCDECSEAYRKYYAAMSGERKAVRVMFDGHPVAAHLPKDQHGTRGAYFNHWCRCEDCRAEASRTTAQWRAEFQDGGERR